MAGMNSGGGMGGGGGHGPWGPQPPRTPPINQHQPSVGRDTLGAAIDHFHSEHPFHVQGERLQNKGTDGIHHPVGSVYKGQMKR